MPDNRFFFFKRFLFKFRKASVVNCLPYLFHQSVVKPQVMLNAKPVSEHFAAFHQMTDICARMLAAGRTAAFFVNGRKVMLIFAVCYVYNSSGSEKMPVARVSARHYAIEQVYAPINRLKYVCGRAHSH